MTTGEIGWDASDRRMRSIFLKLLTAVSIIGIVSATGTFLIELLNFHHPTNIAWMVGLPLVAAFMAGQNWRSRAILGVVLIAWSFGASMLFVYLFWGGI